MSDRYVIDALAVSGFMTNCVVLGCRKTAKAAIIDPGDEVSKILSVVEREKLDVVEILLTHGHVDHVSAVAAMKQATGAPVRMHPEDVPLYERANQQRAAFGMPPGDDQPPIDHPLADGDTIAVGELSLQVLHTPGHSPGSVSFYLEREGEGEEPGLLVCGDTLFPGSIGRTDLWGGSYATLMKSIGQKILGLPDDTLLYSGHGPVTSVGRERESNPFRYDFVR